ncbi:unnamed protein product [Hermetia illucens]|uniref:MAPK regulated corepressor interacting protein 2 n=1 Tax=Hermetia illucens TaxID=343691 RepID=A0A7R8UJ32_HERIL|nr:MAPK regulated corepressor interacting protein 2 [Hermetia illucens]CAD7081474.1 unnamed protein product [Hermetia illucens]
MYTVSKGPSKIVAKTRRGLSQNYEKLETIKAMGKKSGESGSAEEYNVPRPVFQTSKRATVHYRHNQVEEETLSPQHEEIVKYINESWNMVVAQNPYDSPVLPGSKSDSSDTSACPSPSSPLSSPVSTLSSSPTSSSTFYCVEPPSPVLSDFKPFDLESWWGRRLFNNITKSL